MPSQPLMPQVKGVGVAYMLNGDNGDWKSGGPRVMWKGTKSAHLMVPMGPMPKQPAPPKAPAPKPAK